MKTNRRLTKCNSGMALLTTILLLVLLSSLLAGFLVLVTTGQQLTGGARQESRAFYGAEAGLEKMTADLGTLFDSTYAPTAAELANITANPPPSLGDLTFTAADGTSGYTLTYPADAFGKPLATHAQVKSGPYAGMTGLITPYTLTTTARTPYGAEVELRRTTQTVGIPAFEFGVFCDKDCGFHAGPDFQFGGRVHSNRNLYLAEGSGSTLTLSDKVTAYGEVVRTNIMNGLPVAAGGWTGTVNITTSAGTSSYRALGIGEGSVNGMPPAVPSVPYAAPKNESGTWPSISKTNYNSNIINGLTGAKKLSLPIELLTKNKLVPGQPVDIIRRPLQGDDPVLLGERYFSQASLKILLSDNLLDIMLLPCIDTTTPAVDLSTLAYDSTMPASYPATDPGGLNNFKAWYSTSNPNPVPVATSAAGIPRIGGATGAVPAIGYAAGNGYWVPKWDPTIKGYIKIEIQIGYNPPCGKWQDVTQEILKLGIAGRNLNQGLGITAATQFPNEPPLPGTQIAASTCPDPSPNAVIRLERVRDNPSNYSANGICGVNLSKLPPIPTNSNDYWPNVLFDTREGIVRDVAPAGGNVTLSGIIHYVELDANNLGRWFTGQIGKSGPGAFDPQNQPYDYVVYFSDRRGNYLPAGTLNSTWPPVSPSGNETGEYGFNDFVNSGDAANGCPDGRAEKPGEDLAENGVLYTYGMKPTPSITNGMFGDSLGNALTASGCAGVAGVWPGYFVKNAQDARMNPPLFFRRALKVVNGSNLKQSFNVVSCPGSSVCGLTVVSENPVYVQGDYNANSAGLGFSDPHVASAVIGDAVTLLSNKFNDVNSFSFPYNLGNRTAATTWYRLAILAGKGPGFPWITGTSNDFGSDGGMHNFLRYTENWGGQTLHYTGSIVSLFYSRQAVGTFKCCTTVYSPPTRGYNFDTDFLDPSLLPPRTPMFRDINTTGFAQILYADQK